MKFLGIEEPDFTETGEALVDQIKQNIAAAPGNRWNKTGRLMNSIDAVKTPTGVAVIAGGDRLQRDETAELFAEEILPKDLDEETRTAIAEAIFKAFTVNEP